MNRRSTRAFTILEMLLAVAIAGLLLGASTFLLVSLSSIWARRTDMDSFEEHADGVASFIQAALDDSTHRYQPSWTDLDNDTSSDKSTETKQDALADAMASKSSGLWSSPGVTMKRIDEDDRGEKPKLCFAFFQMPPALGSAAHAASPGVDAWLIFEKDRGLAVVWKDIWTVQSRLVSDDKDLLRSSLISPFVTRIDYIYLDKDNKRWIETEEPRSYAGSYAVPTLLRLTFTEGERTSERMIVVPDGKHTMPLF